MFDAGVHCLVYLKMPNWPMLAAGCFNMGDTFKPPWASPTPTNAFMNGVCLQLGKVRNGAQARVGTN